MTISQSLLQRADEAIQSSGREWSSRGIHGQDRRKGTTAATTQSLGIGIPLSNFGLRVSQSDPLRSLNFSNAIPES